MDGQSVINHTPCINKVYKRNGVWLYKPIEKQESLLLEHDGDDQSFEFMSTYIEQSENKNLLLRSKRRLHLSYKQ